MESLQVIQQRIGSVKNISKIAKAMEVVAATKMRKSQEIALASRPYTHAALDLLGALSNLKEESVPALILKREVKRTVVVMVTSDKGLAGSFNSAVIRKFQGYVDRENVDVHDPKISFIAVGQKAANFFEGHTSGFKEKFTRFGDYTTLQEIQPLAEYLIKGYIAESWDEVLIFSTNFKSALVQTVVIEKLLPLDIDDLHKSAHDLEPKSKANDLEEDETDSAKIKGAHQTDYIIEPSPGEILDTLTSYLVEMRIYHIILEANASEHAARRTAMKNASDNARDLIGELTIAFNKSRQTAVTNEVIEIIAGAEALV